MTLRLIPSVLVNRTRFSGDVASREVVMQSCVTEIGDMSLVLRMDIIQRPLEIAMSFVQQG